MTTKSFVSLDHVVTSDSQTKKEPTQIKKANKSVKCPSLSLDILKVACLSFFRSEHEFGFAMITVGRLLIVSLILLVCIVEVVTNLRLQPY